MGCSVHRRNRSFINLISHHAYLEEAVYLRTVRQKIIKFLIVETSIFEIRLCASTPYNMVRCPKSTRLCLILILANLPSLSALSLTSACLREVLLDDGGALLLAHLLDLEQRDQTTLQP